MMPEGRRFPYNFLPRLGVNISITFGDPLPLEDIKTTLGTIVAKQIYNDQTSSPDVMATRCRKEIDENTGWVACNKMAEQVTRGQTIDKDASRVRSEVTAIVQRAVEALGRKVSGDMLRNG
jgi:monolysocardiolipin acyltransferase